MYYYIGPWIIRDGSYEPPQGTIGSLDLRSIPDQSNLNGDGYGLFITQRSLDSNYDLLSSSDIRSSRAAVQHQNIFESLLGYRPDGDMVSDLIFDIMTNGSHPDGLEGVKTMLPANGNLDLNILGIGRIGRRRLVEGRSDFNRVRDVRRNDYRKIREADQGNLTHLKFLAMLGEDFQMRNPEDHFIPDDLPKERPVRPATTLHESFPTDGTTLVTGQDQTWNQNTTEGQVISSQFAQQSGTSVTETLIIATNLSFDNMFCRLNVIALNRSGSGSGEDSTISCVVRYTSTGPDYYHASIHQQPTTPGGDKLYSFTKVVGGVSTTLIAKTTFGGTKVGMKRLECVGSNFCFHDQESSEIFSTTDTAITGNVQAGFHFNADNTQDSNDIIIDDITISDSRLIFFCFRQNATGYLNLKGNDLKQFKTIKLIDL